MRQMTNPAGRQPATEATRTPARRLPRCRSLLTLAVLLAAGRAPALAQAPASLPPASMLPAQGMPSGAAIGSPTYQPPSASPAPVSPATGLPAPAGNGCGSGAVCGTGACTGVEPLWDIYVRGGIVTVVGNGTIDDHVGTGWTVTVGLREALPCHTENTRLYADVGLSYTQNQGVGAPVQVAGVFQALVPPETTQHFLNNFATVELQNLQRSTIHGGLDWEFYPEMLNGNDRYRTAIGLSGGGRFSKVRAEYQAQPSADLVALALQVAGPGTGRDPNFLFIKTGTENKDYAFGMYAGVGASFTMYDVSLIGWRVHDVTLGARVDYIYDWFNLGTFDKGDDGLANIVPSLSLGLSF